MISEISTVNVNKMFSFQQIPEKMAQSAWSQPTINERFIQSLNVHSPNYNSILSMKLNASKFYKYFEFKMNKIYFSTQTNLSHMKNC